LLTPEGAATYLGLGSRWAVYRLVAQGQLPALKLAGKLRIDRVDLDRLIEALKISPRAVAAIGGRAPIVGVPSRLVPLPTRRTARRPVTAPVTRPDRDA
jgi:excisionase family DNA binding protein